jgi:hypothetical protein
MFMEVRFPRGRSGNALTFDDLTDLRGAGFEFRVLVLNRHGLCDGPRPQRWVETEYLPRAEQDVLRDEAAESIMLDHHRVFSHWKIRQRVASPLRSMCR